jgi:hypothetical protein
VGVSEQEIQLALAQLVLQRRLLLPDLLCQIGVVRAQLGQLDQVPGSMFEVRPARDVVTQLTGLACQGPGRLRVVPDARLGQPAVQLG